MVVDLCQVSIMCSVRYLHYKTVYMNTMDLIFLHVDELHFCDQFVKQHNLWIGNTNACKLWCQMYSSIFVCHWSPSASQCLFKHVDICELVRNTSYYMSKILPSVHSYRFPKTAIHTCTYVGSTMTPKENIFMTTVPFLFGGQCLYFHLYCFVWRWNHPYKLPLGPLYMWGCIEG
jgi:hypothetical protein